MQPQLVPIDRFERILLASEGSEFSDGAERVAIGLAKQFGARIHAIRMVVTNDEYDVLAPERVRERGQECLRQLEMIQVRCTQEGVACEVGLKHGVSPADEILEAADEFEADLIVMGRRGRRGLARMMVGQATSRVVGKARCKVLVVPRAAEMWQQRILLATDGSRYSDAAATAACRLAQLSGLPLLVLSVVRDVHGSARRKEAEAAVQRIVAFAEQLGVAVVGEVVEGDPDTMVIETAKARQADLLVAGSHGRTGIGRLLLGSQVERMIGQTVCPLMAVKG
jgi:nucleotide-binding universal stress UspA family protein